MSKFKRLPCVGRNRCCCSVQVSIAASLAVRTLHGRRIRWSKRSPSRDGGHLARPPRHAGICHYRRVCDRVRHGTDVSGILLAARAAFTTRGMPACPPGAAAALRPPRSPSGQDTVSLYCSRSTPDASTARTSSSRRRSRKGRASDELDELTSSRLAANFGAHWARTAAPRRIHRA